MKKICFLTYNIFDLGGIQRVTSVIANELAEHYSVDILCTNDKFPINRQLYNLKEKINVTIDGSFDRLGKVTKVYTKILKKINKETGMFNNKNFLPVLTEAYYPKCIQNKLVNYLNSKDYDVIIGVAGNNSLILGMIADKLKAKTIGWQHNSYDAYLKSKNRYFWRQDELFKAYLSKLDEYIVLTEYDQRMFKDNMNIDCKVIYNPRSFKSEKKSSVTKKQFLAAGRFNYQKGFDMLIESFNLFAKKNNEWQLVIVGEGEEKEKIEALINKYNLNNRIRIDNFTDNIQEYFLNSSVLLLPSRWEGMPMIVLESLEMGVPIISYDITAVEPLIVHKENGIIVEKYDIEKYSEEMLNMVEKYNLKEMSVKAINKSKNFSIENISNEWVKIIK